MGGVLPVQKGINNDSGESGHAVRCSGAWR